MSFLGNSTSRPNRTQPEPIDRASNSGESATFLGEANLLGRMPDTSSPAPSFTERATPSPSASPTPPERCTNVIASGARWKGTLNVEDSVRIDGNFAGEIQAKGTVHVADGAQVDAKVRAAFVVVSGNFSGEIRCDQRVELLPRSRVNGEVITKVLVIQEGAILDGRVQMTNGSEMESSTRAGARSARPTPAPEEPAAPEARPERVTAGPSRNGSTPE